MQKDRVLSLREPMAWMAPLLLCVATVFCSPRDGGQVERTIEHAGAITMGSPPFGLPATPIVPGTTAGYLPATSAVTPTGEFTYRIPLDVVPGRAGMQPSLALSYASRTGNGLLGVGWRLEGLSEIHRCGKTFAQEGTSDGIDFESDDSLCLDGQKLVAVSANPGVTEYRTEQDSLARILAHDAGGAPTSFVVWRKDGRILEYEPVTAVREENVMQAGALVTVATDVTLVWRLFKERDRAGNEARYEYDTTIESDSPHALEYHPSAIRYTYQLNTNGLAARKVVFSYEDRPDPTFAYVSGVKLQTTKRLAAVAMHGPNPSATELVWQYTLNYAEANSHHSLLRNVTKCGAQGGCLLAKRFAYRNLNHAAFLLEHESLEMAVSGAHLVFDANGDGKDDLLYEANGTKTLRMTGAGPSNPAVTYPLSHLPSIVGDASFAAVSLEDSKPVDIDGDGVVELAGLVAEQEYRFFRWNDAVHEFQTVWAPIPVSEDAGAGACASWSEPVHFTDLNGDALPDLIKTLDVDSTAGSYNPRWYYWLNQGGSFAAPVSMPGVSRPYCYPDGRRSWSMSLDLRGNNRGTLIVATGALPAHFEFEAIGLDDSGSMISPKMDVKGFNRRVLADLNGDGLRDWVGLGDVGLGIWWNTGRAFRENVHPLWPYLEGVEGDFEGDWHVADIDADGDDDLLIMKDGAIPALSIFRYVPNQVVLGVLAADGTKQDIHDVPPGYLGDFNGDGNLDIASRTAGGVFQVRLQEPRADNLLECIRDEDSSPCREAISYLSSTWYHPSDPTACQYPQRCIHQGMKVVTRHSRAGHGTRHHSYEDPRVDLRGRGFLGFGTVRVWDPDRGTETTTVYDHETTVGDIYPYALLPKEVIEVSPILEQAAPGQGLPHPASALARVVKRENLYQIQGLNQGKSYLVHPASWSSSEWEQEVGLDWTLPVDEGPALHISGVTAPPAPALREMDGYSQFDDHGNVREESVRTHGGVKRTTLTSYEIREADWLVGLVHRRRVTSAKTDGLPPRTVEYAYDARGLLTQVRVEPNHPDPDVPETITLTRSPDDGLVEATTRQAAGQPPRTRSVSFGDAERVFPERVWNDLNHTTWLAYHPAYGTLGNVMDANGVRTPRIYDDLGRLRSMLPQGGATVTVGYELAWSGIPDPEVVGNRVTVSDETGREGFIEYDFWDRPVLDVRRGFDGSWIHRGTEYDELGNVAAQTRPGLGAPGSAHTGYRYDSLGRMLEVQLPDNTSTGQSHTFFESRTWDAEGHLSYVVRDLDDRPIKSVQMLGATELETTYQYREFDQVDTITDPQGNVIELGYDQRGRRTHSSDPNRGATVSSYNGYGELRQTVDALNQVTVYHRDVLGRIEAIDDADGVTELQWVAGGNGIGQLGLSTSPDGTVQEYTYDVLGRPERLDWTVDGEAFSVAMSYDAFGRVGTIRYPEVPGLPRVTLEHTYNARGYLEELTDVSSTPQLLWRVDERNLDDAITLSTFGNGVAAERHYHNVTGRLEEIHAGPLYSLVYSYLDNGLVQSRADFATGRSEVFDYDTLNRLRFWQLEQGGSQRNTEYQYDVLGNLEQVRLDGQVTEDNQYGGFGAGPHAITVSSLHGELVYDARGRRTDGVGKHVVYTTFDLPREVTTAGGVTTFAYDASGARVKKTGPSGTTISLGELYERRTDVQGETKHVFFVKGGEGTVAQLVYNEMLGTNETQYVLTDALGSVGVVTDTFGQEVERHAFEPFGKRINDDGSTFSGGVTDVRTGFTGHGHDDELGLIDMRGRVYDPLTRRFLTVDPIVALPLFGQSYNGYSYVLNSPVNLTDPSGYEPAWWGMPIPSAAMCGYVSAPYQASVHISSSSGGFDSFGEAFVEFFETLGEGFVSLFGGGSSGATPTHKPAPYDPYAPTAPGPTYADIENVSLPSTTSIGAGLQNPVVVERSGSEKVRDFIRQNDPYTRAEYDAYTDFLSKVFLGAACVPVLAYAGAGSALAIAGIELAGTGAAVAAAPIVTTVSIGSYQAAQGLRANDEGLVFEGVVTGLSGGAMIGDGLGAGPRAFAGGRSTLSRPLTAADLGLADDAIVHGTFAVRDGKATAHVQYLGESPGGLGASLLGARNSLKGAARAEGASTLRIETSPVIEDSGTLVKGMAKKGFQTRPNGTMWWEGGL